MRRFLRPAHWLYRTVHAAVECRTEAKSGERRLAAPRARGRPQATNPVWQPIRAVRRSTTGHGHACRSCRRARCLCGLADSGRSPAQRLQIKVAAVGLRRSRGRSLQLQAVSSRPASGRYTKQYTFVADDTNLGDATPRRRAECCYRHHPTDSGGIRRRPRAYCRGWDGLAATDTPLPRMRCRRTG
jgi:hypothetical protein